MFTRCQSPANSMPVTTIAIVGSVLNKGANKPRDLDVFVSGPMTAGDEMLVRAWAFEWGIPHAPLDVHVGTEFVVGMTRPSNGVLRPHLAIPVPWGTFPRYEVIRQGYVPVWPVEIDGLASALRGEAQKPGAFAGWLAQAKRIRVHLGHGYMYPSIGPANCGLEEDALDGLTALQNALRHLSPERATELLAQLPFAATVRALVERGPRQYDDQAAPKLEVRLSSVDATASFRGRNYDPDAETELMEAVMEMEV